MRTLALLALAVAAGPAPAAPVPKELRASPDPVRIQGVWVVVVGESSSKGYRWTFDGEKLFAGGTASDKGIEYRFAIRPAEAPHGMDLRRDGHLTHIGLYKFVGDELHVCYHSHTRPTEFAATGGAHLHILKRLDEEKK